MAYVTKIGEDFTGYSSYYDQLNPCDATTGWALAGDGGTLATDNTRQREGTNCLDMPYVVSSGQTTIEYDYGAGSGQDISTRNYLSAWCYIPAGTGFTTVNLTLTDDAGTPVAGTWNVTDQLSVWAWKDGWNYPIWKIGNPPDSGSQPDMTDIRKVKFTFVYDSGSYSDGNFYLDDVRVRDFKGNESADIWRPSFDNLQRGVPAFHADGGDTVLNVSSTWYLGTRGLSPALFLVRYDPWASQTARIKITGSVRIPDADGVGVIVWDLSDDYTELCYAWLDAGNNKVRIGYVSDGTHEYDEEDLTINADTWYAFELHSRTQWARLLVGGSEAVRKTDLARRSGGKVAFGVYYDDVACVDIKDPVIQYDPDYDLAIYQRMATVVGV